MSLLEDLKTQTNEILAEQWIKRDGVTVPEPENLKLTNDTVLLDATFLYADLADSTELVILNKSIAAEVMKAYLRGTTRIIRNLGGEIRSFDGDRVMGVFIGDLKNTKAAEAALKINYFFKNILAPAFEKFYSNFFSNNPGFKLSQTSGIDTGKVMVVRGGIRNNNDLVWVGRPANIAAKLSAIREDSYYTYITKNVFMELANSSKYGASGGLMWEERTWEKGKEYGVPTVYRSSWWWTP